MRITGITLSTAPEDAARLQLAPLPGARRGAQPYINPYTGLLLAEPRGEAFFKSVTGLHRWLLAGTIGKQVVGASTVGLLVLSLSGLYLRWPRRIGSLRSWLLINPRKRGRGFLWDLHASIGTWVLPFYLLASVTGLYWSYDRYRDGLFALSGLERPQRRVPPDAAPAESAVARTAPALTLDADALWASFEAATPAYSRATLRLPSRPGQPAEIIYQDPEPAHSRANNHLHLDVVTGAVSDRRRYSEQPLNARLMGSMLPLHSGEFFGLAGLLAMMLASLLMPLFAVTGWMLYLDRRGKKRHKRRERHAVTALSRSDSVERSGTALETTGAWLIGFASQSGIAEGVAWQTAGVLQQSGAAVSVHPLSALDENRLIRAKRALFVVSTFGDGEPPDNARSFFRRLMSRSRSLGELQYGLLALGDREYRQFCGFGRRLSDWLRSSGAQPCFEHIEMNSHDPAALQAWRRQVARLCGQAIHWEPTSFRDWRLSERRCLNHGSQGQAVFYIALTPQALGDTRWQAGDIAEIRIPPRNADETEVVREYSIASLPQDGVIELLVRQTLRSDGSLGRGSARLTQETRIGDAVALRLRRNSSFHGPTDDRPMILIGNGTGMAGLRAHLKARINAGHTRNWLLFGERNAGCDFYFAEEIRDWLTQGAIERLDLAFSRDTPQRDYVQQRLRDARTEVYNWVQSGACLYLCGSVGGMASGVDEALNEILGPGTIKILTESGRYRRDVY
jgi:sulfite reductase (NADPH) flavoprotein alpha-component